jgi:hypothetical protein
VDIYHLIGRAPSCLFEVKCFNLELRRSIKCCLQCSGAVRIFWRVRDSSKPSKKTCILRNMFFELWDDLKCHI